MTHLGVDIENYKAAMDVVIRGLQDDHTHLGMLDHNPKYSFGVANETVVYRPRLERRLGRLENKLQIPMNERHLCTRKLKEAKEVHIQGTRVNQKAAKSVVINEQPTNPLFNGSNWWQWSPSSSQVSLFILIYHTSKSVNGRTLWLGKENTALYVKDSALEYYADLNYKGFHSEGRIVSTLFGLLFWDMYVFLHIHVCILKPPTDNIFAPIPGAFETPFQPAPLDILEDAFYTTRKELIEQRLEDLITDKAPVLLEEVLDREGPKQIQCIGVDWVFDPNDLLDIVKVSLMINSSMCHGILTPSWCLRGNTLAVICQMICEDYGHWRSGVPDLLIWNVKQQGSVEVKSPNDTLQENQKVWIDILLGAGASVDLCHVSEEDQSPK
ncbi:hypothetical protein M422DRAFT_130656, partial [Sphaerobolus stellatus SS14]